MNSFKSIAVGALGPLYRALPEGVRKLLSPLKDIFGLHTQEPDAVPVQPLDMREPELARLNTEVSVVTRTAKQLNDIDWPTFRDTVLIERDKYKGVFIQNRTIDWDVPLFQRPQHMCVAFGKLGYLVIYRTINGEFDDVIGFRNMGNNVWLTNSSEIDAIDGAVRSIYSTVDPTSPEALMAFRQKGKIVYEYIDHIDETVSGATRLKMLADARDYAFDSGVDYVVASARMLEAEALAKRPGNEVIYIPNGVDCSHYRKDWSGASLSDEYKAFLGKYDRIVGYFGALAPWLWYELIRDIAERRPEYGFVFIGPDYFGGSENLPDAENVLWLGPIDYRLLPGYAKEFDVAIIPFAHTDVARTTSPLKLFEYFAMEVPVVVTSSMDECCAYDEVLSAHDAASYVEAIDKAFELRLDRQYRGRLAALADGNDWTVRAKALEPVFEQVVDR
ncbi:glycosyltransferase [Achromobacter aegrifaciens]